MEVGWKVAPAATVTVEPPGTVRGAAGLSTPPASRVKRPLPEVVNPGTTSSVTPFRTYSAPLDVRNTLSRTVNVVKGGFVNSIRLSLRIVRVRKVVRLVSSGVNLEDVVPLLSTIRSPALSALSFR